MSAHKTERSTRPWTGLAGVAAILLAFGSLLAGPAQKAAGEGQPQDEEFAKLVREWTTRPEFLSPLVDHLPTAAGVPSPKDVLGHHVGQPKTLTYYGDLLKYYRALDAASPRVKVVSVGRSDEGREGVVVFVGSEESIADLDRYRGYLGRLADPRGLSEAEAGGIIARAKPLYHFIGGLHCNEPGPSEMLMELAYRLAVEESPLVAAIREKVIVSITPAADPDGRDRFVDWHYAYKIDETGEDLSYGDPPYWGKYVRHDNNRDINFSQLTTRLILDWYLAWHPPIVHDLHESVAFLYTMSGQAPQDPHLDPIHYGEMPWFSNFEMAQMTKYGMPGVWTHAYADMWYPGYLMRLASNHNSMMRMYETFSSFGANTMKLKVAEGWGGSSRTSREWYRPFPAYREVVWSLRNNTNYMETAALTALQLTAAFPEVVLDNFYRKSRNAVEAGRREAPFAYVVPAGQRDATRVAFLVNTLRIQGIEVGRAGAEVKLAEGVFAAGSYIVKLDQPYGRLARILLGRQAFPDDPGLRTYDDTGWTMGLLAHVDVREIADRAVLDAPATLVDRVRPEGRIAGDGGDVIAVAHFGSARMITLRHRLKGLKVAAAERTFTAGGIDFPPGSYLVDVKGDARAASRVKAAVEDLGLEASMLAGPPGVPVHEVDLPRLAVYSIWGNTKEVGWVRFAFDTYEVAYDLIFKEQAKAGDLRARYDVIVIPNQERNGKGLITDLDPVGRPLAYRKSGKFPSLGMYGESDDITGGMGLEGALEFKRFVDAGGVLITLGTASFFPAEFGLARNVDAGRPAPSFYAPGPIVEAEITRPSHPIFYGYDRNTVPVRYAEGPVLRVQGSGDDRDHGVLMRFRGGKDSVLSGLVRGADDLRGRPAIVETAAGKGRIVMFATNPCFRFQNLGEFNMLFNAVLHFNDTKGNGS